MINTTKLDAEIRAALLPLSGVSLALTSNIPPSYLYPECRIDMARVLSGQEKTTLDSVVAAHDPTDNAQLRSDSAETSAASIPSWATWSIADWNTWFNANISAAQINAEVLLIDAKAVQIKQSQAIDGLAKMVIALRNRTFPRLPGL